MWPDYSAIIGPVFALNPKAANGCPSSSQESLTVAPGANYSTECHPSVQSIIWLAGALQTIDSLPFLLKAPC
jgi:hypothetical protein